jgi:hypothetical protein
MVYYVLALALFQPGSYDDVAENLVGALEGVDEAIPNRSSFTQARQRLGAGVIEAVFRRLAGPVAPPKVRSGRSRRFSAARRRSCGQRTPNWSARRYGRIWRCTTA